MAVNKLLSFINHNKGLWSVKRRLKDTTVIIDSTALLYYFMEKACLNRHSPNFRVDVYGGNLIGFGRFVREFFDKLASVNVKPIVVIQGSPMNDCEHEQTRQEREVILRDKGLMKLQNGLLAQEQGSDEANSFIPELFKIVYRQILAELKIETKQAVNSSRKLIAQLSNDLKCPVLAGNSEYILFPVEEYIQFKNLYMKNHEPDIDCFVIQQKLFLDYFPGLKRQSLPLLNALLGNHRIISENFVAQHLDVDRCKAVDGLELSFPQHQQILDVLLWLSQHSLEESIELILENEMPEDRERVRIFIREILKVYDTSNLKHLESVLDELYPGETETETNREEVDNQTSSKYLLNLFNNQYLSDALLDMVLREPHFDNYFLDDPNQPSTNLLKFRPYSVAMALLRSKPLDKMEPAELEQFLEKDIFTIHTRSGGDYMEFSIKAMRQIDYFGSLDHLSLGATIKLSEELKRQLLMSTFRYNQEQCNRISPLAAGIFSDQRLIEELTLCMMLVKYSNTESGVIVKPSVAFTYSLMLAIVYYANRSTQLDQRTLPRLRANMMFMKLKRHAIMNSHEKYSHNPEMYRQIMHFISSLQATYKSYNILNNLLARVGHVPDLERWFNGALIYRVTKLIIESKLTLEDLCKDLAEFVTNCHKIAQLVRGGVIEEAA